VIAQKQMDLIIRLQNRFDSISIHSGENIARELLAVSQLLTEAIHILTALHDLDVASEGRSR
jgi:hypothetical protein